MSEKFTNIVQRAGGEGPVVFTEAALAAQDGKTVPLTLEIGGPVVGEATLRYDPEEKALKADFQVDDPKVAKFFVKDPPNIFG
jgi:hypothetical protein